MLKQYKMSTGNHTQAERVGEGAAFHGEHILDRMRTGFLEEVLSRFWEGLGGKSQAATLWPWLLLVSSSEALLSEGWSSRAPVSSRSDMLQRVGGSLGFHWCQHPRRPSHPCMFITYLSSLEPSILKQKVLSFQSMPLVL